jgi:hypothetical protein
MSLFGQQLWRWLIIGVKWSSGRSNANVHLLTPPESCLKKFTGTKL